MSESRLYFEQNVPNVLPQILRYVCKPANSYVTVPYLIDTDTKSNKCLPKSTEQCIKQRPMWITEFYIGIWKLSWWRNIAQPVIDVVLYVCKLSLRLRPERPICDKGSLRFCENVNLLWLEQKQLLYNTTLWLCICVVVDDRTQTMRWMLRGNVQMASTRFALERWICVCVLYLTVSRFAMVSCNTD